MNVVVTGGSGGIGSALCDILEQDGHRAIVLDAKNPTKKSRPWIECNFSSRESVNDAVSRVRAGYGALHALVNLVGIYRVRSFDEFSWEEFDEYMSVNLQAPLAMALEWERVSRGLDRRCLVNVSSAGALRGSRDLAYAASKAALLGATRSLARSLSNKDVVVIGVTPGLIESPMSNQMSNQRRKETVASTIARRPGTPEELSRFLAYLVENATDYLTGSILPFDGGLT